MKILYSNNPAPIVHYKNLINIKLTNFKIGLELRKLSLFSNMYFNFCIRLNLIFIEIEYYIFKK